MKKIFLLFVIVLMGAFSTIATAQTDNLLNIAGLEPDLTGQTTYYLKNVGTGLHMSYGATHGTQCIETQAAHPAIVEDNGDGTFAIANFGGYLNSENLYMDQPKGTSKWKLVKAIGYTNQYYLYGSGDRVLTSVGNSAGILALEAFNGRAAQRWIFTNGKDIKDTKMPNASADCPYDVTMAIKGAAFDYVDSWEPTANTPASLVSMNPYNQKWENYNANAKWFADCGVRNIAENYNYCGIINGFADALTITYKMTLPKGTYHFSFEAFYKYMKVVSVQKQTRPMFGSWSDDGAPTITTTDNGTMAAKVTFADQTFDLSNHSDNSIYDDGEAVAAIFRDNDIYKHHGTFYLNSEQEVSIVISKPATTTTASSTSGSGTFSTSQSITTTSYPSQIYIDDFTLLYYGTDEIADEDISHNAMFASYLNANIAEITEGFCDEAIDAFKANFVDIDAVDTRAEYYAALSKVDAATEAAKITQCSIVGVNIVNHSFETGDITGWTQAQASSWMDANVQNGGEVGKDGEFRFNAWCGIPVTTPITQTLTGLVNGMYELKALVASDPGNMVYLMGNGYHVAKVAEGAGNFVEVTLPFLVEDGTATIGVVGGNNGYYYLVGGWYKVDNFRMKYICDLPHGRLKLALDEAAAVKATFDEAGKAALNISNYEAMYDNKSLSGDGFAEVAAIHDALQAAAKVQTTVGADMTWTITNHSFETGNYEGWTTTAGWDTQAAPQEHATYATIGTNGRYVFNTWTDGTASPISQTVNGIPNGIYKVSAMVASTEGHKIKLTANEMTTTINAGAEIVGVALGEKVGVFPEVICAVNNNELTITVEGVDDVWYKADNFRLIYLGDEGLKFDESANTISSFVDVACAKVTINRAINVKDSEEWSNWSTFVVPFNMDVRDGWEVKKLISSEYNEETDNITLVFENADAIEAGVPYMVRVPETVESIVEEEVLVNTTLKEVETDFVIFAGTYTSGNVPTGSYFISGNKFYRSVNTENPDKIKGFRAYITPKSTEAKSISYRFDSEDVTGIEGAEAEATVVGIYTLSGVRINDMQEGVNILQMSDGTTIKVVIK